MSKSEVALVVGAYGDIGHALCLQLVEHGLRVVGWDIQERPAELTEIEWSNFDLADAVVPKKATKTLEALGQLNFVFHVVGGSDVEELRAADPAHVPLAAVRRTINLNLVSAFAVLDATADLMSASQGGRSYTFTSSINALGGYGSPGYSAAKAGLHGMVHSLAVPLGRRNIRINAVALGTTQTNNYARLGAQIGQPADFIRLGGRVPRGTVTTPHEAARTLLSVGVDMPALSGTVVVADLGQSIVRPHMD